LVNALNYSINVCPKSVVSESIAQNRVANSVQDNLGGQYAVSKLLMLMLEVHSVRHQSLTSTGWNPECDVSTYTHDEVVS